MSLIKANPSVKGQKISFLSTLIPALIAFAAGVLLIAYQPTFFIIVACAVFAFGGFQIVKYLRAKGEEKDLVVLIVGVFMLLSGVLMGISPDVAAKVLLFIELGLGVWAAVTAIVNLLAIKKRQAATEKKLFLARLIAAALCLCLGILLIVFAFTGMDTIVLPDRIVMGIMLIVYAVSAILMMQKQPAD